MAGADSNPNGGSEGGIPGTGAASRRPPGGLPPALLDALRERFGERLSLALAVRESHGRDESSHPPQPPDAVVYALSTAEVAEAVQLCAAQRCPLIAFGAGTSVEGQLLAVAGGLCLDLSRMNRVLAIDAEDLTATVQPGVTRLQLNAALREHGLFFPVDPGADATLGGMTATRASGTNAVRYGTMRENTLALEVVTGGGAVLRSARRVRKSSAGYDLTRLLVGSEGTLGVITEVTVRVYPLPEAISAATARFPSVDAAVRTVIQTVQLGVPIARAELLDALTVRALNAHSRTRLPEQPLLFLEFHGSPAGVKEQAETVQALAAEHGGEAFEWTTQPERRSALWQARHDAYFAVLQLRPGCRSLTTDTCVPISRLAALIAASQELLEKSRLPVGAPVFGHVGDGNFHCMILFDPADPAELAEARRLSRAIAQLALDAGGSCSGEHGVGIGKLELLEAEHGPAALELMRAIRRSFDPHGILNPGKLVLL